MLYHIRQPIPNLVKVAPNITLDFVSMGADIKSPTSYFIIYSNNEQSDVIYGDELTLAILKYAKESRLVSDIVTQLHCHGDEKTIKNQLVLLSQSRILIDADYEMSDSLAAYWLNHDTPPSIAEKKIKAHSYVIHNNIQQTEQEQQQKIAQTFTRLMSAMGFKISQEADDEAIHVVLVTDYLQGEVKALNDDFYAHKKPWILLSLVGEMPLLGPVFNENNSNENNTEACYQCLYKRMRESRQVRNTIGKFVEGGELTTAHFIDLDAIQSIAYRFVLEIAKHAVLGSALKQKIVSFDWQSGQSKEHYVQKLPQCSVCGECLEVTRELEPFIFDDVTSFIHTSGGYKSSTPLESLKKYQHLVSPLSGVVAYLERVSDEDDDWSFVYKSGNNIALQADNINISVSSVRMHNAGKGKSNNQAKISALSESIERYCCSFQGDEIRQTKRFIDFPVGEAILPNEFMHYSERQYTQNKTFQAQANPFHFVPAPCEEEAYYEWSPIWSVFHAKAVWVPTQLLYFGYPYNNNCIATADTNGVAAGNSKTEAFVQAFFECIERDNIAIWWYNRLRYPEVDLSNFNDYSQEAVQVYRTQYHRKLYAIDISHDLGVPTFLAISYRLDEHENQEVCFSAASHFDADIAMTRAICEQNQLLNLIQSARAGKSENQLSHDFAYWLKHANINHADFQYLVPSDVRKKQHTDYATFSDASLNEQRERCLALCRENQWELYVADFTRIDIQMPVLRVLIPALRTMHTRLAKGRLYDVPVKLGMLKEPIEEKALNPMAIFI